MTFRSTITIGADQALEKHHADGNGIVWAIVDSGIDGSHDHFKKHANLELPSPLRHRAFLGSELDDEENEEDALVDIQGHGTHLGGIVAGELSASDSAAVQELGIEVIRGIAPRAKLVSVKVLDEKGQGDERSFIEALQWILEMNRGHPKPLIHGVLIGSSHRFDLANYACGHSPVCEAVSGLVRAGVVVVVPAGNCGYEESRQPGRMGMPLAAYGSITDPGNAELAITVGATHSRFPEEYGASYFSSKGPTLDGRYKPDLLAPGERIHSCAPGKERVGTASSSTYRILDGTSMAAAHVAGAAAALMSVRRTLIGRPGDVKQIFLQAATDLHRIREAQGAGLLNLPATLSARPSRSTKPAAVQEGEEQLSFARREARGDRKLELPENLRLASPESARRFVIAFSYPGEHNARVRKIVGEIRRGARLEPQKLFYAPYHKAEMAQPNLDKILPPIYFEQSELVVVFLGSAYQESEWCGLEWRTILKRVRAEGGERVMLLRLDHGEVKGLKRTDGYIDIQDQLPDEVADLVLERLALVRGEPT